MCDWDTNFAIIVLVTSAEEPATGGEERFSSGDDELTDAVPGPRLSIEPIIWNASLTCDIMESPYPEADEWGVDVYDVDNVLEPIEAPECEL